MRLQNPKYTLIWCVLDAQQSKGIGSFTQESLEKYLERLKTQEPELQNKFIKNFTKPIGVFQQIERNNDRYATLEKLLTIRKNKIKLNKGQEK